MESELKVQMSTSTHTFLIAANLRDAIPFKGSHRGPCGGGIYLEISDISACLSIPNFVQLQFIYERDKYLLKEVVQEMGLKMAEEVHPDGLFLLQLGLLNAPCKNKPALTDCYFLIGSADIYFYNHNFQSICI